MGSNQSVEKKHHHHQSDDSCLVSRRPTLLRIWQKLRRTIKRQLRLHPRKKHGVGFQRCVGTGARQALLRPMPRCSSFGSCGTLLTPTSKCGKLATPMDNHYAQWKCMFEHATGKRLLPQLPHDISEALSGQTTPRGFPSHTDARRCHQLPTRNDDSSVEQPLYDCVGEVKVRRRLSFRLPSSHQGSVRRLSTRQKAAQAKLEAQLQRELCDLEEYYGGFHYIRRNERRV